jgi:hypothetical protein
MKLGKTVTINQGLKIMAFALNQFNFPTLAEVEAQFHEISASQALIQEILDLLAQDIECQLPQINSIQELLITRVLYNENTSKTQINEVKKILTSKGFAVKVIKIDGDDEHTIYVYTSEELITEKLSELGDYSNGKNSKGYTELKGYTYI